MKYPLTKITLSGLTAAIALLVAAPTHADTSWATGGNWAATAGLVDNVIAYPDGITASTTTTQAAAVADTVANDYIGVGIDFVRYPVNPATVTSNWPVTQAAINELVKRGIVVDICCWYVNPQPQGGNGLIRDMATWENMWKTVDGVYGNNNSVYYEPINEPSGYSLSGLEGVYSTFLGLGLKKGQSHFILGGTGYEDNVTGIGGDSSFNNCLLALHDYSAWGSHTTESAWEQDLQGRVGSYYGRTIMTEFGAPTTTGLDYGTSSTDNDVCFVRGMTSQCRSWGMGSVWFPADQAGIGNNKRMFNGPGAGVINQSLVNRLQYGWNITFEGVEDGAAIINSLPTPEIAGVDTSGNVWHKWIQTDGTWSGWTSLGSPTGGAKQSGAIMGINMDGSLEVFVTGASDGAVYNSYESPSGWTAFSSLGGGGGNLSSPAVILDNDGRLNLFVVGGNNAIWWDKQTVPGGSWMGWTQITGTMAKSGEAPTAILNASGNLEVFYNKSDNSEVCHVWQMTSGGSSDWTWNGQTALGGGANLSGLSATRNTDGRLDVSVVGSNNKVWHNWQTTAGGSWNGWASFDTSQSAVSGQAPCLTVNQSGALEMFINGTNGHVYRNWQTTPGGGWNGWADMGGGGNNLTRFWGVTQADGDLEVFVVGGNNAIWTDVQTSPGGNWGGWNSLGGTFASW